MSICTGIRDEDCDLAIEDFDKAIAITPGFG